MKSNEWFKAINTNPVIKGDGAPDFASAIGQLYVDITNGVLYINEDGETDGWVKGGDQTTT